MEFDAVVSRSSPSGEPDPDDAGVRCPRHAVPPNAARPVVEARALQTRGRGGAPSAAERAPGAHWSAMPDLLVVLALAAIPAAANLGGGLLAELRPVSDRVLSMALHGAAGIVLAVVAIELMPEVLAETPPLLPVGAFLAGGLFYMGIDIAINFVRARIGGGGGTAGAIAIWFAVAVDLFSDGILIGTGSSIELGLGVLLALGQAPADVPEGFASIATLRRSGVPRQWRLIAAAAFVVPILAGALFGYVGVQGQPDVVKFAILAFTAGILTTVTIEEIVPEAHRGPDSKRATLAFIGGFSLFAFLSAVLG